MVADVSRLRSNFPLELTAFFYISSVASAPIKGGILCVLLRSAST